MLNKTPLSALILISIGISAFIVSTLLFIFKTTALDLSLSIDSNYYSHYGAFVSGVSGTFFSLAGIIIIIKTIEQNEKVIKQNETSMLEQQIEGRFYELLKIHRDNCVNMSYENNNGKTAFVMLFKNYVKCYHSVSKHYFLSNRNNNVPIPQGDILINLAFVIFYFGRNCKDHIVETFTKKNSNISKHHLDVMLNNDFYHFPIDPLNDCLSQYFRHLYQTVKYINSQKCLEYEQKYQYIKTLRAQLSHHEQIMLFINSLSYLGGGWEKNNKDNDEKLITKYNLIKNLNVYIAVETKEITDFRHFDVRKYYPNITYEGELLLEDRQKLEKEYN